MKEQNKKIDIENVKYPVVTRAMNKFSWEKCKGDRDALIIWWDGLVPKEEFYSVLPYQRINKIPGMNILCLKSNFFQTLNRMKILFDSYYNFYPTTYLLPIQYQEFQNEHLRLTGKKNRTVTWILKPKNGCGGSGIRLVQNNYDVAAVSQQAVIQRYIEPYLFGGYKFDFRLYVLVSNLAPYTVYIYKEGLARFCSHLYMKPNFTNINDKYSHLTNTSVNIDNEENSSSILQLSSNIINHIEKIEPEKGKDVWKKIKHVVMLTFIAQYHEILKAVANHNTDRPIKHRIFRNEESPGPPIDSLHKYFHLFGIDIMLNRQLEPIVLELNDRPSLVVTFDIEEEVKSKMILDMLKLVTSSQDCYKNPNPYVPKVSSPIFPKERPNMNSISSSPTFDISQKQAPLTPPPHVHLPPPSSTPHSPHFSYNKRSLNSPQSARSSIRTQIQLNSTLKPSNSTFIDSPTSQSQLKTSSNSSSCFDLSSNDNDDNEKQKKLKRKNSQDKLEPEIKLSLKNKNTKSCDDMNDDVDNETICGGWELILPIDPSSPMAPTVKMMIDKSIKDVSKRFLPFTSYITTPAAPRKVSPKFKPHATLPPLYKNLV